MSRVSKGAIRRLAKLAQSVAPVRAAPRLGTRVQRAVRFNLRKGR